MCVRAYMVQRARATLDGTLRQQLGEHEELTESAVCVIEAIISAQSMEEYRDGRIRRCPATATLTAMSLGLFQQVFDDDCICLVTKHSF